MKVLIINGSPRTGGNTETLLNEVISVFNDEGVEHEIYNIGTKAVQGCIGCGGCYKTGECVFGDDAVMLNKKLEECDGLIVASPVYYASANGSIIALLDRMFNSTKADLRMKVGASFAVARRGGTTATLDVLNKYFFTQQMPVASGCYWNMGFGMRRGEVEQDLEGVQNARCVARNMVFMMKSFALGKEKFGLPEKERKAYTNFIS